MYKQATEFVGARMVQQKVTREGIPWIKSKNRVVKMLYEHIEGIMSARTQTRPLRTGAFDGNQRAASFHRLRGNVRS